tara:strand:- start:151 stop:1188 length:1038 start_codon:yes stop_codon:yes gene_type:complete
MLGKKIYSLDKFLNYILYNKKEGYYQKKIPFGLNGDYTTSPNISVLFSEMISIFIIIFWEKIGKPKSFNVIEMGGGNGEMIFQINNSLKNFPQISKICNFYIYENSKLLKKFQKKKLNKIKVNWINNLDQIKTRNNLFIANEFFDSLPIKQFKKKKQKWYEKKIRVINKKNFEIVEVASNLSNLNKKLGIDLKSNQNFIEYSPLEIKIFKKIAKILNKKDGGLLIIDYGFFETGMRDTLQSLYKHKYNKFLMNIGNADITHHVNFNLIEKLAKNNGLRVSLKTYQKNFLLSLGIKNRAEHITKKLPFSKKADVFYRMDRLINENKMGHLFKVILLSKNKLNIFRN